MIKSLINYSNLFDNKIKVFLTQVSKYWDDGYPSSRKKKIKDYLRLKDQKIIIPKQIHSDIVVFISNKTKNIECDAIIFNSSDIVGSINVADCVPICIYDTDNGLISLVHSGWKGTYKKIVIKTIERLQKMGSNKKSLKFFLGPSIKSCCYEVDDPFILKFDPIAVEKRNGKYFINLPNQIKFDLEKEDIPLENIILNNQCTFDDKKCHSFRRDGESSGRMSLIAYKNTK